jgi:LmbE family N-acetylglucosaminyl deacetylase
VYVEITNVMDAKLKALCSHTSQISDPDQIETLLRDWASANAKSAGLPDGAYAEMFRAVDTR